MTSVAVLPLADLVFRQRAATDPVYVANNNESLEWINSMSKTNGTFDTSCDCERMVPSRLHELHESKIIFVLRIEFIRSKLSNFPPLVSGVAQTFDAGARIIVVGLLRLSWATL